MGELFFRSWHHLSILYTGDNHAVFVLSIQWSYLGDLLSRTNGNIVSVTTEELERKGLPFKYCHLGSFAFVGDNRAVLQVPILISDYSLYPGKD